MNTTVLYTGLDEISSHKTETRLETLQAVINERAERERELVSRHPMVPVFVNWAIVFMAIALVISLIVWGISIFVNNRDESIKKDAGKKAVADYVDSQNQAAAEEYEKSEAKRKLEKRQSNAMMLAMDSGVWKTETAFKGHCWNVCIRVDSPFYPDSIEAVLTEPGQYDYANLKSTFYDPEKYDWAMEVLEQAESGRLPIYLTTDHIYEEMRNGGNECVLHTVYQGGPGDDPWRYRE